ncbi:MAG: pitrilysin family protein, partial [Gammaproteobacteria bacterium]
MRALRLISGLCLAAVLAASATAAPVAARLEAQAASIRTTTLQNGLKVIVWPDHDIPNVALYTWFHVGSRNERPGITGLSHFFEHMMFNGTSDHPQGDFDRIMEARGGSNNAYTTEDVTVYQDWFPRHALDTILSLEADRMAHLAFKPEVIESERGVVYSERRSSVDNDNFSLLMEQVQSTAFVAHPYHIPVIGWPSDIEHWTIDDLRHYYHTYYAPNNATMVVVGDVDPAVVFARVRHYFGGIPGAAPPAPIRTVEPPQPGPRRVTINKPAQSPIVEMAFHTPKVAADTSPAVDLLLTILTDGDSSRLHKLLVEDRQAAISVGGYRHKGFDPGLTWLYAVLPTDGDPDAVENMMLDELARIADQGVSNAELAKARSIRLADFWRRLSTISGKAQVLGEYEAFHGGYGALFSAPESYEAVTSEAIRDVARQYFTL